MNNTFATDFNFEFDSKDRIKGLKPEYLDYMNYGITNYVIDSNTKSFCNMLLSYYKNSDNIVTKSIMIDEIYNIIVCGITSDHVFKNDKTGFWTTLCKQIKSELIQ